MPDQPSRFPEKKNDDFLQNQLIKLANLLKDRKCECSGVLVQSRKECKTAVCMVCGKKYVAVKKKK